MLNIYIITLKSLLQYQEIQRRMSGNWKMERENLNYFILDLMAMTGKMLLEYELAGTNCIDVYAELQ